MQIKEMLCGVIGVSGSLITGFFGGWTSGLKTLLIFMVIDYISGLVVAAVFKKSSKSKNGALESNVCWKGLIRKGMTLLIVGIAYRLDVEFGTSYIRDAVVIAFIANELISIVENAGLMGVPMPAVITNAIEILQKKSDHAEE